MTTVKLVGDWTKARKILQAAPVALDKATTVAVAQEAEFMRTKIVARIRSNVQPANSLSTVLQKRSTKTLVADGDLIDSVAVVNAGGKEAWIGVPRSAGKSARLADVLEHGRVIIQRMTKKQRRFLRWLFSRKLGRDAQGRYQPKGTTLGGRQARKGTGNGIIVIYIPPRPFITPVFEEQKDKIPARFTARVCRELDELGAPLGKP